MSKKDFENLLNKHSSESEEEKINWDAQKTEWLEFIKQFYESVELWLKPYTEQNKIKYEYKKIELTEEYIGVYETKILVISFANQQIKLKPIGTLLIGTKGRIDMEGARGRVQFILADKDSKGMKISVSVSVNVKPPSKSKEQKSPDWTWKIVLREPRGISYENFNEENFFNAMMEVANG